MMCQNVKATLRLLAVASAACLIVLESEATPSCDLGSVGVRSDRTADYLPFSNQPETLVLTIEGAGKNACRIDLRLSSATDGTLIKDNHELEVSIRTRQGRRLIPNEKSLVSLTLLPSNATGVSAELIAHLPPRQLVAPGLYEGAFELEVLREGDNRSNIPFNLSALVASQADIRLAGRGGRGAQQGIDFGTLETGREESALVSVRSNGAYAVEVESENNWHLELETPASENAKIAYSSWFNEFPVSAQSVARVPEIYRPSGRDENLSRLRFRIGETEGKPAGRYTDTVRLTVVLLE